jgi:prepilin-type N-terminal cleavage/methylation domain-containing protein
MCRKNNLTTQRGFSLIEMLIVIAVIGILAAISWFQFSAYSRKSAMESQIRTLYGDLMEARTKAMFEKKVMALTFAANSYTIAADGVVTATKTLNYPITWNNAVAVEYRTNGLLPNAAADGKTICLSQVNEAPVDAVVISMTRIQIGKKIEGADCVANKIIAK